MDLSKIPTEDLKAIQAGKWSDVSTPGLQEYQRQRQATTQAMQQAQNPQQIPDAADKAAQNNNPNAQPTMNAAVQKYQQDVQNAGGGSVYDAFKKGGLGAALQTMRANQSAPMPRPMGQTPMDLMQNMGVTPGGINLSGGVAEGSGLSSALSRIAQNAGGAGLQQYLSNITHGSQDPTQGVLGAATLGGGVSSALEGASAAGNKLGDYLMQRAVGIRGRVVPGQGIDLANQGVWGTKSGMASDVTQKLGAKEKELQNVVHNIPGRWDAQEIADKISPVGSRFNLPSSGDVAPGMEQYAQKVKDATQGFQSMGEGQELSAPDLLSVKRQGDWLGYTNAGNKATSLEAELGRAQANAARDMLSDASDQQTRDILSQERSLINAKTALDKPDTIHQGPITSLIFGKVPGQALLGSMAGQAAVKGGQTASTIADPALLQGLFGLGRGMQGSQQ